jgi:hypothetical protein
LKNLIFVIYVLLFLTSCAHVAKSPTVYKECSKIAYGENSSNTISGADNFYTQCLKKKELAREKKENQETTFLWVDMIFELLLPNDDN